MEYGDEGFMSNIRCSVGKGNKILFWSSLWWGDQTFQSYFPDLFDVSTNKFSTIFDSVNRFGEGISWLPTAFMGSADTVAAFTASSAAFGFQWQQLNSLLAAVRFSSSGEDNFEWFPNLTGTFSMASVSQMSAAVKCCAWQPQTISLLKISWKLSLPLRIQIFAWRFFTSRLPTKDALISRGVVNIPNQWCVFYGNVPESLPHIFFSCHVSLKVWERIFVWLGEEVLFSFEEFLEFDVVQEKVKAVNVRVKINTIWMALIWSIWSMRNSIIFYQVPFCFDMVVYNVIYFSWSWLARIVLNTSISTFYEWYKLPLDCFSNV
ncbi:uncharacterized protein LOC131632923 [Vicia villosa]|uniref:uncharacterized protein LOC131632923 n=1 Tax=Vicia villosa TaxID=3911 RepID=UPI00273B3EC2|nr:uncharacterized protein LOC131632923 [Vicia villosa]